MPSKFKVMVRCGDDKRSKCVAEYDTVRGGEAQEKAAYNHAKKLASDKTNYYHYVRVIEIPYGVPNKRPYVRKEVVYKPYIRPEGESNTSDELD